MFDSINAYLHTYIELKRRHQMAAAAKSDPDGTYHFLSRNRNNIILSIMISSSIAKNLFENLTFDANFIVY